MWSLGMLRRRTSASLMILVPPGGDGPHGQRFMTGDAELAHQQHLRGHVERTGHLEPDRDAPAWQSQDITSGW
jgi:hypothetical protein